MASTLTPESLLPASSKLTAGPTFKSSSSHSSFEVSRQYSETITSAPVGTRRSYASDHDVSIKWMKNIVSRY